MVERALTKESFLGSIPHSNIEWAAQQIMLTFNDQQFFQLKESFDRLNEAVYKAWAKDMSFNELLMAIDIVSHFQPENLKK